MTQAVLPFPKAKKDLKWGGLGPWKQKSTPGKQDLSLKHSSLMGFRTALEASSSLHITLTQSIIPILRVKQARETCPGHPLGGSSLPSLWQGSPLPSRAASAPKTSKKASHEGHNGANLTETPGTAAAVLLYYGHPSSWGEEVGQNPDPVVESGTWLSHQDHTGSSLLL